MLSKIIAQQLSISLANSILSKQKSHESQSSQLFVIDENNYPKWNDILDATAKKLGDASDKPLRLVLHPNGEISSKSAQEIHSLERWSSAQDIASMAAISLGISIFCADMWGILQSGPFSSLAPITDTVTFLSFNSFFSIAFAAGFPLAAYGIAKYPRSISLEPEGRNSRFPIGIVTSDSLIGTPKAPGLLFQTRHGLLVINNLESLQDDARCTLETLVSNKNIFYFPTKEGHTPLPITYRGQIIIGCKDMKQEFSTLSLLSGRTHALTFDQFQPSSKISRQHCTETEPATLYFELAKSLPNQEDLKQDPFKLFIGRDKEIEQLKIEIKAWIDAWRNREPGSLPPTKAILVCDSQKNTFGQGKTSLLEAAKLYSDLLLKEGISLLFPGIQLNRIGYNQVRATLIEKMPSGYPKIDLFTGLLAYTILVFVPTMAYLFVLLNQSVEQTDMSLDSKKRQSEFNAKTGLATLGIGSLIIGYMYHLHQSQTNSSPYVMYLPTTTLESVEISTPPHSQDWVGRRQENTPPQHSYTSTAHGHFHGLRRIIIIESGALDPSPQDSKEIETSKKNLAATLSSLLFRNELLLAETGPPIPYSGLLLISSNRPLEVLQEEEPYLAQPCKVISLEGIVPFDDAKDQNKFFQQLLIENKKKGGVPWTDKALNRFADAIQFKEHLAPGKAIIVRHYFEDLLDRLIATAITHEYKEIREADFVKAWTLFLEDYKEYFDPMMPQKPQPVMPEFNPPEAPLEVSNPMVKTDKKNGYYFWK